MNGLTDQQLLREYTQLHGEAAFGELVRRYVDLVYSAALRMVRDAPLAEDVTQGVFVALSRSAGELTERPVLSGWLHRTAQNLAANAVRADVRRRAREHEAAAMNDLLSTEPDAAWEDIAPQLDAALGELSEPDRDALLQRYFERKSAREMAQSLGTSEEAAQKRVTRAVERLRELLVKRGVTAGAGGLVVLLSANAVQAAPVGLALSITASTALAGAATVTLATSAAAKTLAMTTLQKALIATTLAAAIGVGTYEARQASLLRAQVKTLQQQAVSQPDSSKNGALGSLQTKLTGLEAQNTQLVSALTQANAAKVRLETEREQARHSIALYKELVEQANAKDANPTNQYPTSRHVWAALGRLGRLSALSRQDDSKLSADEKAALETARIRAIEDLPGLLKAAKHHSAFDKFGEDLASDALLDDLSCLFYGALNLDEQQFSHVYGLMEKYRQQAMQQGLSRTNLGRTNSTPEAVAAFTRILGQWKTETQALLAPEQAMVFSDLLTNNFKAEPGNFGFNFGFPSGM